MKKLYGLLIFLLFLAPALFAQEHYTEGPVWRVQLIRVKPNQMDAYLSSLRQSTKPLIEEQKKAGVVMDYKIFLKETKNTPEDWDICVAVEYKNSRCDGWLGRKGRSRPRQDSGQQTSRATTRRKARRDPGNHQLRIDAGDFPEVVAN